MRCGVLVHEATARTEVHGARIIVSAPAKWVLSPTVANAFSCQQFKKLLNRAVPKCMFPWRARHPLS